MSYYTTNTTSSISYSVTYGNTTTFTTSGTWTTLPDTAPDFVDDIEALTWAANRRRQSEYDEWRRWVDRHDCIYAIAANKQRVGDFGTNRQRRAAMSRKGIEMTKVAWMVDQLLGEET